MLATFSVSAWISSHLMALRLMGLGHRHLDLSQHLEAHGRTWPRTNTPRAGSQHRTRGQWRGPDRRPSALLPSRLEAVAMMEAAGREAAGREAAEAAVTVGVARGRAA